MRSLFVRIFVSFWVAMTLIGGVFAVIYATSVPESRLERFRFVLGQTLRMHAVEVLAADARGAAAEVAERTRALRDRTVMQAWVFRDGVQVAGPAVTPQIEALRGEPGGTRRTTPDEHELVEQVPGGVVVGVLPRRSRLLKYISPDTLPLRLVAVVLISGLVCFILAGSLTRRVRLLRATTQTLAAGDLTVRVSARLTEGRDEASALGRDIDRMAERITSLLEARRRLLRDISHELRSPLARLTVALELARDSAGSEAEGPLDRIEREAQRLGELIGEVLTLTRLDGAEPRPQPSALDLGDLVDSVVRDADFEARGRGARVELMASEPVSVDGVAELLRRAVENVVRNAVRFTPEGTAVEVQLRPVDGGAEVRVRDHGPGLPEDQLEAIFEPFYRLKQARDRASGGVGLGLAIAAHAVKLHGGAVSARNAEGGGLEVTLRVGSPQGPTGPAEG